MSTQRDRARKHEKCMFNFKDGRDKKREKSFDNARKKRLKKALGEFPTTLDCFKCHQTACNNLTISRKKKNPIYEKCKESGHMCKSMTCFISSWE